MNYKKASLEIIEFSVEDIILTSSEGNDSVDSVNTVEDFRDGFDL